MPYDSCRRKIAVGTWKTFRPSFMQSEEEMVGRRGSLWRFGRTTRRELEHRLQSTVDMSAFGMRCGGDDGGDNGGGRGGRGGGGGGSGGVFGVS